MAVRVLGSVDTALHSLQLPLVPPVPRPQVSGWAQEGRNIHSTMRGCHREGNQGSYFLATELPHTLKSRENNLEHTFKVHKCRTKGKYTLLPYIDSFIQKCICKILTHFELGSKQILRQNLKSCRSLVNALGLSLGLCILMSSVME